MGFLDTVKSKLNIGQGQNDYADGGYDDYYGDGADDGYDSYETYDNGGYRSASGGGYGATQQGYGSDYSSGSGSSGNGSSGNGLLGQTRRGEAESVAVYTRSGQPVGESDRHASTYSSTARESAYRPGAYDTPSTYTQAARQANATAAANAQEAAATARINTMVNGTAQLPAYILRPESYDDVETVVRRVRTRQPVALVFHGVRTEVAKRVLDFSYGFACGLGASVEVVGDRVFMVLPQGCEVKEADLAKLRSEGYLKK